MVQLIDQLAFGLRTPHLKHVVERRIGHPHAQVSREDEKRVPDRLDNFFRILLGVSQRQNDQPAEAAKTWEPLLAQVDANAATALRAQINAARSEADLPPLPEAPAADLSSALLTVVVDIAPELNARLSSGDVLFVFARQAGGPPMPVAAKRVPATEFPITVALSDSDSPMPTMKLSQADNVELVARISKAGDVTAKPGDLEATPLKAEVRPGAEYSLRIDRVVE